MTDILQDTVTLQSVDNDGKHYDQLSRRYFAGAKASRSSATASAYVIDINTSLYPIELFSKYKLLLSKSDAATKDYDYVAFGQVYKINDDKHPTAFFVSFGGLLMQATVSTFLAPINVDDDVYLMLRKSQ